MRSPAERAIDFPPKGRYHNYSSECFTKGRSSVTGERPNFFDLGQLDILFINVVNFVY